MTKKKTFEESMKRLDEILKLLETNEQPLDVTIQLFEEGLVLAEQCDQQLSGFEKKVQELMDQRQGSSDE